MPVMRTTIVIDDDVLEKARSLATRRRAPLRVVINEALRAGLKMADFLRRKKPYRTAPHAMGLKPGRNLDNIQELLAQTEGEGFR